MKKEQIKNKISLLCFIIFMLLVLLSVVQELGWLRVRNAGVIIIYAVIFALPMWIYRKIRKKKASELLRLHGVPVRFIPHILVISLAICLICGALNAVGYLVFSAAKTADNPTALLSFTSQNPIVLFITMVLLPALTEELLLRGAALSEYEHYGTVRAVLLTALIFALFHANPMHLLSLFTAGVCYGVMTKLFGSVWPAVFAHMLNNWLALLLYQNSDKVTYILSDALFVLAALIVIFLLLVLALKMTESAVDRLGKKIRYVRHTGGSPLNSIYLFLLIAGCIGKMIYTYFL